MIHTSSIPHGFVLQTKDLDEAATLLGDSAIPYVSELLPNSPPFSTKIFVTRGQQITLSRVVTSGSLRVEATLPGDAYALVLDLRGGVGLHRAYAQNIPVSSDFALLQSPLETVEAHTPPEFEALFMRFSRQAVVSELSKLLNREIQAKLEFAPALRLKTNAGKRLRAISGELRRILYSTNGHEVNGSLAIRGLEDELLRLLLETQPHNYTRLLHRSNNAGARQIADAEEYMRANAHLPVTLGDVCEAAGVNARTLQNAFRRNRDSTPMQFLRTIRMQEVRAGLLAPHPETSVSREAARWGFLHFGRFSGEYRAAYGELPSETLKRARKARMTGE